MSIKLLDCTLRDGGFLNDWRFGALNAQTIVKNLISAGIEIIELGFIEASCEFEPERQKYPTFESCELIFGGINKGPAKFLLMHDVSYSSIVPVKKQEETCIDGIRIIFKKHMCDEAIEVGRQYAEQGFEVSYQFVATLEYTEEEVKLALSKVSKENPYCVSIVDTYGQFFPSDVSHLLNLFDSHLDGHIKIGFHAHNNLQLAFSNSLKFIELKSDKRHIIIDATLNGFGKGAGNTPLELLVGYLNRSDMGDSHFDVGSIFVLIDFLKSIIDSSTTYGYSLDYCVSATSGCHPNYVETLRKKYTLTLSDIHNFLQYVPEDQKLKFSKSEIENIYKSNLATINERQKVTSDYLSVLKTKFAPKNKILLVAPGKSIQQEKKSIQDLVNQQNVTTCSINFYYPNSDIIYLANQARVHEFESKLSMAPFPFVISTENVKFLKCEADLILPTQSIDSLNNATLSLLRDLSNIGIDEVYLAGFDGFNGEGDYCNNVQEYRKSSSYLDDYNKNISQALAVISTSIKLNFVTESLYEV